MLVRSACPTQGSRHVASSGFGAQREVLLPVELKAGGIGLRANYYENVNMSSYDSYVIEFTSGIFPYMLEVHTTW